MTLLVVGEGLVWSNQFAANFRKNQHTSLSLLTYFANRARTKTFYSEDTEVPQMWVVSESFGKIRSPDPNRRRVALPSPNQT